MKINSARRLFASWPRTGLRRAKRSAPGRHSAAPTLLNLSQRRWRAADASHLAPASSVAEEVRRALTSGERQKVVVA